MGYVKKQAFEEANKIGACVYEIKATERTEGTLGFWWCGRFAMHRWEMPIEEIKTDLTKYEHVIICFPIWAFSLAAPVRSFCKASKGKIKEVEYISMHFSPGKYKNAVQEADTLLETHYTRYRSVTCRMGTMSMKEIK